MRTGCEMRPGHKERPERKERPRRKGPGVEKSEDSKGLPKILQTRGRSASTSTRLSVTRYLVQEERSSEPEVEAIKGLKD